MSNEHTPGPWSVEWKSPCHWLIRDPDVHLPPSESADCPNRRLIAAAPELLPALEEALVAIETLTRAYASGTYEEADAAQVRFALNEGTAAINKAKEGEEE